jgi:hypothetical protein
MRPMPPVICRCIIALLSFLFVIQPNVSMATNAGLRGITNLQLTIGLPPTSHADCSIDHRNLERVGIELFAQAGLQAITADEALQRSHAVGEHLRRNFEAIRSGQRLQPTASEAAAERRSSLLSMRNLPGMMILFATDRLILPNGETICSLAVSADFAAPPAGVPTIAASGQAVFAPLVVWRHPTLATISSPENIRTVSVEKLEIIIRAMLSVWQQQNQQSAN